MNAERKGTTLRSQLTTNLKNQKQPSEDADSVKSGAANSVKQGAANGLNRDAQNGVIHFGEDETVLQREKEEENGLLTSRIGPQDQDHVRGEFISSQWEVGHRQPESGRKSGEIVPSSRSYKILAIFSLVISMVALLCGFYYIHRHEVTYGLEYVGIVCSLVATFLIFIRPQCNVVAFVLSTLGLVLSFAIGAFYIMLLSDEPNGPSPLTTSGTHSTTTTTTSGTHATNTTFTTTTATNHHPKRVVEDLHTTSLPGATTTTTTASGTNTTTTTTESGTHMTTTTVLTVVGTISVYDPHKT